MKVIIRQMLLFLIVITGLLAVTEHTDFDVKPAVKHYYTQVKVSGEKVREEFISLLKHYSNIADNTLFEVFPPPHDEDNVKHNVDRKIE